MKSSIAGLFTLIFGFALSVGVVAPAHAANITIPGLVCRAIIGDFDNFVSYAFGSGIANTSTEGTLQVVCPIPRSPLASGAIGAFYVDGANFNGATTTCSLGSYDFTGRFLGASTFTAGGTYDQFVSLPAAELTNWAYAYLYCLLPAARPTSTGGYTVSGFLFGLTSVQ